MKTKLLNGLILVAAIGLLVAMTGATQLFVATVHVYFTYPGISRDIDDSPVRKIVEAIESFDGRDIFVGAYTLTSDPIAVALKGALAKFQTVNIVVEATNACAQGSDIQDLYDHGARVFVDGHSGLMHHKFILLGHPNEEGPGTTITGSYNFSASAEDRNFENVIFLRGFTTTDSFFKGWDNTAQLSEVFKGCQ